MSTPYLPVILDAIETCLREGPKTATEVAKAVNYLEPNDPLVWTYPRTYARLRKLAVDGRVARQTLDGGRVIWMLPRQPEDDDLETMWNLPAAEKDA